MRSKDLIALAIERKAQAQRRVAAIEAEIQQTKDLIEFLELVIERLKEMTPPPN